MPKGAFFLYKKLIIRQSGLEHFNIFKSDEVLYDSDILANPGELAVMCCEVMKLYGVYEGLDETGNHVLRYLDGVRKKADPRVGSVYPYKVCAVMRGEKDVLADVLVSIARDNSIIAVPTYNDFGVFIEGNKVWTTSRDVAAKFEKPHNDVLKSIRKLDCSREFSLGNFSQSNYTTSRGKKYPQYLMTRDGFTFLAMGFAGPKAARFKELYIAEFNRMEEELYRLRFSCNDKENIELRSHNALLESSLKLAESKVTAWDKVCNTDNTSSIGEVAKVFGVGQNTLFSLLRKERILFKREGFNYPMQRYINNGAFSMIYVNKLIRGEFVRIPQVRVRSGGMEIIRSVLSRHKRSVSIGFNIEESKNKQLSVM